MAKKPVTFNTTSGRIEPESLSGQNGRFWRCNTGGTAMEFANLSVANSVTTIDEDTAMTGTEGGIILVDTTTNGSFEVTLPANPADGDQYLFVRINNNPFEFVTITPEDFSDVLDGRQSALANSSAFMVEYGNTQRLTYLDGPGQWLVENFGTSWQGTPTNRFSAQSEYLGVTQEITFQDGPFIIVNEATITLPSVSGSFNTPFFIIRAEGSSDSTINANGGETGGFTLRSGSTQMVVAVSGGWATVFKYTEPTVGGSVGGGINEPERVKTYVLNSGSPYSISAEPLYALEFYVTNTTTPVGFQLDLPPLNSAVNGQKILIKHSKYTAGGGATPIDINCDGTDEFDFGVSTTSIALPINGCIQLRAIEIDTAEYVWSILSYFDGTL